MSHAASFMEQVSEIARNLDHDAIEKAATTLAEVRDRGGRLFILGVGEAPAMPGMR